MGKFITLAEALKVVGLEFEDLYNEHRLMPDQLVVAPREPQYIGRAVNRGTGEFWHFCGMSPVLFSWGNAAFSSLRKEPYALNSSICVCIEERHTDWDKPETNHGQRLALKIAC